MFFQSCEYVSHNLTLLVKWVLTLFIADDIRTLGNWLLQYMHVCNAGTYRQNIKGDVFPSEEEPPHVSFACKVCLHHCSTLGHTHSHLVHWSGRWPAQDGEEKQNMATSNHLFSYNKTKNDWQLWKKMDASVERQGAHQIIYKILHCEICWFLCVH